MSWLIDLRTRTKFFVSFGVILFLLAAVVLTALTSINALLRSQRESEAGFLTALDLVELRADISLNRARMLEMIGESTLAAQQKITAEMAERSQAVDARLKVLHERRRADSDFLRKLETLEANRRTYQETRSKQITLLQSGAVDGARTLASGDQQDRFEQIRAIAVELGQDAVTSATKLAEQTSKRATQATWGVCVAGAIALAAGILLAVMLTRMIAIPLQEISLAAEDIAAGDLTTDVSGADRHDEVGLLATTFGRMTTFLRGMADAARRIAEGDLTGDVKPLSDKDVLGNAFDTMTRNLRKITADIAEGVNMISSSAGEISTSTSQLAASAAETATAVNETTTTVEEVRQTAQMSSEKSKVVADTAQEATRTAEDGKNATEETGAAMTRIRGQMESIAQSMVRLSEQTQAIGEIIATVDDLAQQSNLLAVNASIEAAKAGEEGKGFSVVAQEVKSLAEQSREATTQVRSILSDIQKATSAAVMATEQGGKVVETGVEQSTRAGGAIETLTHTVSEAARAATQIAASSQQQLVGMEQVVDAMENIKQASGQNVESAKQLETAARNLGKLGQRLKGLGEQFKNS